MTQETLFAHNSAPANHEHGSYELMAEYNSVYKTIRKKREVEYMTTVVLSCQSVHLGISRLTK